MTSDRVSYTVIGGYTSNGEAEAITVITGHHQKGMVTRDGWVITITANNETEAASTAAELVTARDTGTIVPAHEQDFTVVGYFAPDGKPQVIAVLPGMPALKPVHPGRWAVAVRAISAISAADKAVSSANVLLGDRRPGQD